MSINKQQLIGNLSNVNGDDLKYFDSFEIEYIPKKILKFVKNNDIITNIY